MKIMNLIFSFLFIHAVSSSIKAQSMQPDSLTIDKTIQLALENQPLIKEAEDYVNVAAAKIKEQKSFNYPEVDVNLSYNLIGPVPTIELPFGAKFKMMPENNYNGNISVGYLLLDFNRRGVIIDLLRSNKLAGEEKVNMIKSQLAYQTAQIFYTILFFEKSLDVKQDQINVLKKHIEVAKKLVESGSAIDLDILTTKVRVAAVENQKIEIKNNLKKQEVLLRVLLGLKNNSPLKLSGKFADSLLPISIDSLINQAYYNREEIKVAQLYQKSANIQKNVSELNDMPTVSLFGNYGLKNGYPSNLNALHGNWLLGVSAKMPLFNGFMKEAKVESAEAAIMASNNHIDALKQKIKTEVSQSAMDLETSKKKMQITFIQIQQANQALAHAQVQYENGVVTNLALLDAQTSLTEAKLLYVESLYEITINSIKLKEAVGEKIW